MYTSRVQGISIVYSATVYFLMMRGGSADIDPRGPKLRPSQAAHYCTSFSLTLDHLNNTPAAANNQFRSKIINKTIVNGQIDHNIVFFNYLTLQLLLQAAIGVQTLIEEY